MVYICTHRFEGDAAGPSILLLGAVHGNEIAGTLALNRLLREFELGMIRLTRGAAILAPVCNPFAFSAEKRYITHNLNRILTAPDSAPTRPGNLPSSAPEYQCAGALMELIQSCDVVLDLHTLPAGEQPFLFLDFPTDENERFARSLPIDNWLVGWEKTYERYTGNSSSGDTISYAHSQGKHGLIVECGRHDAADAPLVAYHCAVSALAHWGLLSSWPTTTKHQVSLYKMTDIVRRPNSTGLLSQRFQHLDPVQSGQLMATYDSDKEIRSTRDGVILLPYPNAAEGAEWFYYGAKVNDIEEFRIA